MEFRLIRLTRGEVAIVDEEDFEELNKFKWRCVVVRGKAVKYAKRTVRGSDGRRRDVSMHRVVAGADTKTIEVDHKDGDGLNNRRGNLRIATKSQNMMNRRGKSTNRSGFKGVHRLGANGRYRAEIGFDGMRLKLGIFDTPMEAHHAYCEASMKYHGVFGKTI